MIRLVVFDVDGVLTDGKIYVDENGNERKALLMTDVDALNMIKKDGYMIAAVTGENTKITSYFAKRFMWDDFASGCKDKKAELIRFSTDMGVDLDDICYIGDGIYDLEAIKAAGFGVCPSNAIDEVKAVADMILTKAGGAGCINELRKCLSTLAD
ncbi:MAG: HAD hydrolase family protein [Lachnospiraceae bacterium]|nr:HAD hydrolase family protein [Lachnospiraceae bacterium]